MNINLRQGYTYRVSLVLGFILDIFKAIRILCFIIINMEQDIAQPLQKDQLQSLKLDIISDSKVANMLRSQIALLPPSSYTLRLAYNHIYITLKLSTYKKFKQHHSSPISTQEKENKNADIESIYTLKISKRFPLKQSVRLLMLDGGFQPKISDTRDLMQQVMGKPYHFSMCFLDIFDELLAFDLKLHHKNEMFLELQKIGKFNLGQKYFYHQITQLYSSLVLMKDNNNGKKSHIYIGVSQTHILTFRELQSTSQRESSIKLKHPKTVAVANMKQIAQKQASEETFNQLILIASAELQCIDSINYKQQEKLVKIVYRRYKSIKLYHQFEEIKRQYKFKQPEVLLRTILKYIAKFQSCAIQFEPYRQNNKKQKKPTITQSMVTHRQNQRINFYIDESSRLEQLLLKKQTTQQQRKKSIQQLNRFYQKLIEHYSARANPYYLIYVNKLNLLYSQYYRKSQINP